MGSLMRGITGLDAEKSTPSFDRIGRAALAWQAEACPTHAGQPPGNGRTPGPSFARMHKAEPYATGHVGTPHFSILISWSSHHDHSPYVPFFDKPNDASI